MKKVSVILFLLLSASLLLSERGEVCGIYIWDKAGPLAEFADPDSGATAPVSTTPAGEIEEALFAVMSGDFPLYDSIIFMGTYTTPPPFDDPELNMIFLTLGWRGSGGEDLSPEEIGLLATFIDSSRSRMPHALYIEGPDMAYLYGDTTTVHPTYSPIMRRLGALLRADEYGYTPELVGVRGSLAEGLILEYQYLPVGPTTSMDDMVIWEEAEPFATNALYLFYDGKGPARGIQRKSFPGAKTEGTIYGAMVGVAFIMGNVKDTEGLPAKAEFLHRVIDFFKPPSIALYSPSEGDTLYAGNSYAIIYKAYDNCGLQYGRISVSFDGGLLWETLYEFVDIAFPEDTFMWRAPELETDNAFLLIEAEDKRYNYEVGMTGPFKIAFTSSVEETPHHPAELSLIRIFPNPFNSEVNLLIDFPARGEYIVEVLNCQGEKVFEQPLHITRRGKFTVNLSLGELPSGLYIVNCSGSRQAVRKNVVLLK